MARTSPGNWPEREGDHMDSPQPDEKLTCDDSGRYGAMDLNDRKLCSDCYAAGGSCCPEFGRKDAADADAN